MGTPVPVKSLATDTTTRQSEGTLKTSQTTSLTNGAGPSILNVSATSNSGVAQSSTTEEEIQNMSAVAAILNPITALKGGKTKVAIYSSLDNCTLGFEQRFLGDIVNKAKGDLGSVKLANPSTLVSVLLEDIVHVYGVNSTNNLCLLNPVYEPVQDAIIANGTFTGCSDGDSEGWLFYQVKDVKANTSIIYEQLLTGTGAGATKVEDTSPTVANTSLAACYDGEHRWLAYQKSNNCVVLRNVDRKKEAVLENTRYTALPKTPLGVVHIPGSGNSRGRVFVYYIHKDLSLRRAFVEIDDVVDFRGYGQEAVVEKSGTICDWTQLSVIADPGSKTNHIYAVRNAKVAAGKQVSAIIDDWGASIQKLEEYHHSHHRQYRGVKDGNDESHHGPKHGKQEYYSGQGQWSDGHYHAPGAGFEGHFRPPQSGREEYHYNHTHDRRPPPHTHHSLPHGLEKHMFSGMSDMQVELGKVNLNALLKLCFDEPRVEYRPQYYKHS
ncbi:hypothetical protein TWF569_008601 [Orbilia oligospora]|uniref:Fucose-specific lectin n=1 Tax=Orbilia oligospora TaxID=2813651 RepID=A0A7C8JK67_ORBOL|nr:hypothetical protein TWF706_004609 [Orbilia oligospora]KAF3113507.1 hypothetical protein TWF102_000165 [Orbilia oligospora]KAF3115259.1 hypothetical protein TWF103_011518 [Orbilia oligospora]KAF3129052.1 hypothetical protein TWF703_009082 [Orbilia oligospora]KAF3138904.1 hypothetical protein TWF569_008601 [Orbilia oligospora]